jgi:hypothetical protein
MKKGISEPERTWTILVHCHVCTQDIIIISNGRRTTVKNGLGGAQKGDFEVFIRKFQTCNIVLTKKSPYRIIKWLKLVRGQDVRYDIGLFMVTVSFS